MLYNVYACAYAAVYKMAYDDEDDDDDDDTKLMIMIIIYNRANQTTEHINKIPED